MQWLRFFTGQQNRANAPKRMCPADFSNLKDAPAKPTQSEAPQAQRTPASAKTQRASRQRNAAAEQSARQRLTAGVTSSKNETPQQHSAVTKEELMKIVPKLSGQRAEAVLPSLNQSMAEAKITTTKQKSAFIAQMAHESGGFKYNEEIASGSKYEWRRDLGNTQPGDGKRFKGRGFIQITGRANYTEAGKALGLDLVNNPHLAATKRNAARIAAWFWNKHNLNRLADLGNFDAITRKINGGYRGKADRDQYYARALGVLS